MRYLLFILLLCSSWLSAQDYISNLSFRQEGNTIVVDYQLAPLESGQYYEVYIKIKSSIAGQMDAYAFLGDIGKVKNSGKKQIIWNVMEDVSRLKGGIKVELKAELYSTAKDNIEWTNSRFGSFVDDRDQERYEVVKIGDQIWMAENLRHYSSEIWGRKVWGAENYGVLYLWEIAKKACPKGWHLPSKKEWENLIEEVGGSENAGKLLKSSSDWENDGNGTNQFGFNVYPTGLSMDEIIDDIGNRAILWSKDAAPQTDPDILIGVVWTLDLSFESDSASLGSDAMQDVIQLPCRCLQD